MNKSNLDGLTKQIIREYLSFNGISSFEQDCAYAGGLLAEVYEGTLNHLPGMVDKWPSVKINPLLLPMREWCEIAKVWESELSVINSGLITRHRDNWSFYAEIAEDSECAYLIDRLSVDVQPSGDDLEAHLIAESHYIKGLLEHKQFRELFRGAPRQVLHAIADNGLDIPLLHWLFFLDRCTVDPRAFVDSLKATAEKYICMESMKRLLS